ncbi:SCO1664 family protein [Paenarthrobacter aurescens]|uniref:Phosphatidylinositol kinase n=1 Tax=Paenarthrobacter aurescens TaxID=43663 RepID=A0A4Y3N9A4_PAEAU|nr:SCO1664 family protein [Paenarthrobacter aurescens]MDO6143394.1 SCO1664 family protein [Paenarthrobacter aurescens]MDO6147242.1 SCO1664 family protein [Paenarthrobacter aurescens]MDO6158486.1 SCO1664 family protein [Paenarthrobacter aurescens]MDO6162469.1 SCO1664 family protein [Paenarthrobacter aurescens]GEB18212.1 phosphatidylinositol kinase [Paenarthrobacter aurescens]
MPAPDLLAAELMLTGRITTASNATFLGTIGDVEVVYKPMAGESPLWDFPHGTLAEREVAAYLVSEAFGWDIVPRTWLRDGPLGEGMVQLWKEQDPIERAVNLMPTDEVPETGWKHVLEGQDQNGRMVALVHEDSPALRRMAVFDAVVNNADRKGNHVLSMTGGHRHGVDHGLTFHQDHKLRTVLWGWLGDPLSDEELEGIDRLSEGLQDGLGRELADLLTAEEIESLATRCERLRSAGRFPAPSGEMSAVPWPLF